MSGHRKPETVSGVPARFEEALQAETSPVWVVDADAGQIIAANSAGRNMFGVTANGPLRALDGAMPGLYKLRLLARANEFNGAPHHENLLFWTARGVETVPCAIEADHSVKNSRLLLVSMIGDHAASGHTALGDGDPGAKALTRDDAETLKEIARAIRNGQTDDAAGETDQDDEEPVATPLVPVEEPEMVIPESVIPETAFPITALPKPVIMSSDLSKLAHELKTPLSAIVSASEVIRDERLGAIGNERYRGYVSDIHDSAKHALAVIGRMLGTAGARTELNLQPVGPVDLNDVASRAVSSLKAMTEEQGLALYEDLDAHIPRVLADETAIRQIILNLMTNAMKFTNWGGEIHVVTRYARDGSVWLAVRDTGLGMTEEEVDAALDPTNDPALQRRPGGGLGIGLPLVRRLAEANGAGVSIDSAPGRGTAVVLTFPRERLTHE